MSNIDIGTIPNKHGWTINTIVLVNKHIRQDDFTENYVTIGIRHSNNNWLSNTCKVSVVIKDGVIKVDDIKAIDRCIAGHGKVITEFIEKELNKTQIKK